MPKVKSSLKLVAPPAALGGVPVPPYVTLTKAAAKYWPVFTCGRHAMDWLPAELVTVAKVCELEADIAAHRRRIARDGILLRDARGVERQHPSIYTQAHLIRLQLALLRPLAMMLAPLDRGDGQAERKRMAQAEAVGASDDGFYLDVAPPHDE